jgi:hypothetical protein
MKFWRSLLMPLHPTALAVIVFVAGLHALVYAITLVGPLRILPALMLLSVLFKYAYAVLEQASEGIMDAPTPSVEMMGPYNLRPLLQAAGLLLVYVVGDSLPAAAAKVFYALALLLMPASIGVLGVSGSLLRALNPLELGTLVRGLGVYYALVLVLIAGCAGGLILLSRTSAWNIALFAAFDLSVLWIYAAIGGAIYERRLRVDHEPRSSPEKEAEESYREHCRLRSAMLDDVYHPVQLGDFARGMTPLKAWLTATPDDRLERDVIAIMSTAVDWNSERGLAAVTGCIVSLLVPAKKMRLVFEVVEIALRRVPTLALGTEAENTALAANARAIGRKDLALALLRNFQSRNPELPLSPGAAALRSALES